MSTAVVQQLLSGLRSKNRDEQNRSAQELLLFAKTELREMQQDELNQFFDEFNHQTFDMLLSSDNNEKKGGVLAISEYFFLNRCVMKFRFSDYRELQNSDETKYRENVQPIFSFAHLEVVEVKF
jgi:hypothetical protein